MKGSVFYDVDGNLSYRTPEFLNEDPGFPGRNKHFIIQWWNFDTENKDGMVMMLKQFAVRKIPRDRVNNFLAMINFDLEKFKEELKSEAKTNKG